MSALTSQQMIERARSGRIFTVEFVKRTTGEVRTMTCRRGVSKGLKGVGMAFDPLSRGLTVVWDVNAKGHRMINLRELRALTMDGQRFVWTTKGFEPVA